MKFWVRFSKIICKLVASPWLKKARTKSLETVLQKSTGLLEPEMLDEMRAFVHSKHTAQGGFADRGGKCDLYYSLFGWYVAEALSVTDIKEPLKNYVKNTVTGTPLTGVNLYCGAILYAKLCGFDSVSETVRKQVVAELKKVDKQQSEYTNFLGILALYYLDDYLGIWRIVNQYKTIQLPKEMPCPVTAATSILLEIAGKPDALAEDKLKSFYRGKGGFAALKHAPAEDLLSTSVALFALHYMDSDMRLIKPDCLAFVDNLYLDGGFRSMPADVETDVEYTFYGMLALGAMEQ
jgi:hypothetical protein